ENAILQSIGNEQLTVSRGTYSKNISIHIVQAPEIQTFTISGYITSNSSPLENVIVNYSGGSTTTNNFGFYQFQTNEHSNQTITPSLTGYIFEPQQITLTDIQQNYPNQNFTANLVSLDSENFTNISVYPNPAKDEINISGIENPQVIISDLSGRIILTTNSSKININNLSEGMYFLQVDNKMIKIVKK
ncbi:MAG: T9SS type A sorting domain-containing protein, partial [Bacteroidales bacterium]|nr:T9SS type A sorting domain-containing protein [Bacteroidales bacterium]